jgi:hypothetical protein
LIKTKKSYRTPAVGLYYDWVDWVEAATADEVVAALEDVQKILIHFYGTVTNTFHAYSIKWRKPVEQKFGRHTEVYKQCIYQLGLSKKESLERRTKYAEKKQQQSHNPQIIATQKEVLDAISSMAASTDFASNVLAVCMATGARLIEVLKVSEFSPSDIGDNYITITGVAKNYKKKILIRPLLKIKSPQLLELIERIRSEHNFAQLSNVAAKDLVVVKINNMMKSVFPQQTSRACRYMYASLAWQMYGSHMPQQEWVRSVLGHESGDTSLIYLCYTVSP